MNNSKIALEAVSFTQVEEIDRKPFLREEESKLVKVIEALKGVAGSDDWSTLTTYVFNGVVEKLERDLLNEAKKEDPDKQRLASLNGQFVWAKKYADLESLTQIFRLELVNIRKQLYGSTSKES